jgi:mono/diheme cytochrome c family protein
MLGSGAAQAAATDGWYSADQATQGHQLFNNYCAKCHRPDLTGAAGPALKVDTFVQHWGGKPLTDLYGFEHSKMPGVPARCSRTSTGPSPPTSCRRTATRQAPSR